MSFNQKDIKKLSFNTLLEIKACLSGGTADRLLSYCIETRTLYNYVTSAAGMIPNDQSILITGDAGDTRWVGIAGQYSYFGGGSGVSITNELCINTADPEVPGKQYQSFAHAFAYLATVIPAPSATNPWAVRFAGESFETVVVPEYVRIIGDGWDTSILASSHSVDFVSSSTDFPPVNVIENCTIDNLAPTSSPQPVVVDIGGVIPYSPDIVYFGFKTEPVSGGYTIDLGIPWLPSIPMGSFYLDNAAAVDAGGGEVTLPCTGFSLTAGMTVYILGTTNYNGTFLITTVGTNNFNIVATYIAETFAGTETVQRVFAYNETPASIKAAIVVLDPGTLSNIIVEYTNSTDYKNGYTIILEGLPVGVSFNFTAPINTVQSLLGPDVFTSTFVAGTKEEQSITFTPTATQGMWGFTFDYLGTTYPVLPQPPVSLPFDALASSPMPMIVTVQSEMRRIFSQIKANTGKDFGNPLVAGDNIVGFVATLDQSKGATGSPYTLFAYVVDPNNPLLSLAGGKKIRLENVRIRGAFSNTGDGHSLIANDCWLSGGTFLGFDGDSSLVSNSMVQGDDSGNPLQFPKSKFKFTCCNIKSTSLLNIIFMGADFDNCVLKDCDKIVFTVDGSGLANYNFLNCTTDGVITPSVGSTINAADTTFMGAIGLPTGVILNTYNSSLIGGLFSGGGTWNDKGNAFNPFGTPLSSIDSNDAIKEIAGMISAPGVSVSKEIVINTNDAEVTGKQYQTFAAAIAWINTQTPSTTNTFVIRFSGVNTESGISIPEYVTVSGDDPVTSVLAGHIVFSGAGNSGLSSNNIINCTINDLFVTMPPVHCTATAYNSGQVYTNPITTFHFNSTPSSGYLRVIITDQTAYVIDINAPFSASDIQTAIQTYDPALSQVTCTGIGTLIDPFVIAGLALAGNATIHPFDFTGVGMNVDSYTLGTTQVDKVEILPLPAIGTFDLRLTYSGSDFSSSTPINWNGTTADVLLAMQEIFHGIEAFFSLPSNYFREDTLLFVTGNIASQFNINYMGYRGITPLVQIVNYPSLYSYPEQYVSLDNVRIIPSISGAGISGLHANGLSVKNSVVEGGDFSTFTKYCKIYNTNVVNLNYLMAFPSNLEFCNGSIVINPGTNVPLNGGTFLNSNLGNWAQILHNTGIYNLVNCQIEDQFTIPNSFATVTMNLVNTPILNQINVGANGTLNTYGCPLLVQPNMIGGVWNNKGDAYDPSNSGLAVYDVQAAIDALAASIPAPALQPVLDVLLTDVGLTPTIGDRYLVNGTGAAGFTGLNYQIAQYNGATWDGTIAPANATVTCLGTINPANEGWWQEGATPPDAWTFLGTAIVLPVLGVITGSMTPPTTGLGDRYLLNTAAPNPSWGCSAWQIATKGPMGWIGTSHVTGQTVSVASTSETYVKTATVWNLLPISTQAYELAKSGRAVKQGYVSTSTSIFYNCNTMGTQLILTPSGNSVVGMPKVIPFNASLIGSMVRQGFEFTVTNLHNANYITMQPADNSQGNICRVLPYETWKFTAVGPGNGSAIDWKAERTNKLNSWVTDMYFFIGDMVVYGNDIYRCTVNHKSGTFATDLATGNWLPIGTDTLVWDSSQKFQDFYTSNSINTLARNVDVTLQGTGPFTLADATTPLGLTNCEKLTFIGDRTVRKNVVYSAKKPVFLDGFPNFGYGVELDIQSNINGNKASGLCKAINKDINWYLGEDSRIYYSDTVNTPVGVLFDAGALRVGSSQIGGSISGNGVTATVVTDLPHYLVMGSSITSADWNIAGFNGTFTIASVISDYSFTFLCTGNGTPTGGTVEETVKHTITISIHTLCGDFGTPGCTLAAEDWFYYLPKPTLPRNYIINYYDGANCPVIISGGQQVGTKSDLIENVYCSGVGRDEWLMTWTGTITTNLFAKAFQESYDNSNSGLISVTVQGALDELANNTSSSPIIFNDDFLGVMRNEWVPRDTNGTISFPTGTSHANGIVKFITGIVAGDTISKDFGGNCPINYQYKPEFEFRTVFDTNSFCKSEKGFIDVTGNNYIKLVYDSTVDLYWHVQMWDGVGTPIDYQTTIFGFVGPNVMQTVSLKWIALDKWATYANGVPNLSLQLSPTQLAMVQNIGFLQPLLSMSTKNTDQKNMTVDYLKVWQSRSIVF